MNNIHNDLYMAFQEKPSINSISNNSTIEEFYKLFPNKEIHLVDAFKKIFTVQTFFGITTDQLFSVMYSLITIIILILQKKQKNTTTYTSKYYGLSSEISFLQIILAGITLIYASYQTQLYIRGKTFLLVDREFDILVKFMSVALLLGTAITSLKSNIKLKKKVKNNNKTHKKYFDKIKHNLINNKYSFL